MAQKRMFSLQIIDSDLFLDMPVTAQNLYFHLSMRADDDGFISNPKKIIRMVNSGTDDFKILLAKEFVIPFESGICVIKHWKIHNYIQNDRYHKTIYLAEKSQLSENESKVYVKNTGMDTECIQDVSGMDTQIRLDKIRLDKAKVDKKKHRHGEYNNVLLSDTDLDKLKTKFNDYLFKIKTLDEYIETTGKKYKNHYLVINKWAEKDNKTTQSKPSKVDYTEGWN